VSSTDRETKKAADESLPPPVVEEDCAVEGELVVDEPLPVLVVVDELPPALVVVLLALVKYCGSRDIARKGKLVRIRREARGGRG
jgi:hypothetical protein